MFRLGNLLSSDRTRLIGGKLIALVVAAFLAAPSFACHCADGRVKPFCIPGHCGDCSEGHSCCQADKSETCSGPTASKIPCCQFVIDAATPATTSAVAKVAQSPVVDSWIHSQAVDLLCATVANVRRAHIDISPPPVDIVITQLRLTI